jgi:hypothetical protein
MKSHLVAPYRPQSILLRQTLSRHVLRSLIYLTLNLTRTLMWLVIKAAKGVTVAGQAYLQLLDLPIDVNVEQLQTTFLIRSWCLASSPITCTFTLPFTQLYTSITDYYPVVRIKCSAIKSWLSTSWGSVVHEIPTRLRSKKDTSGILASLFSSSFSFPLPLVLVWKIKKSPNLFLLHNVIGFVVYPCGEITCDWWFVFTTYPGNTFPKCEQYCNWRGKTPTSTRDTISLEKTAYRGDQVPYHVTSSWRSHWSLGDKYLMNLKIV